MRAEAEGGREGTQHLPAPASSGPGDEHSGCLEAERLEIFALRWGHTTRLVMNVMMNMNYEYEL